jgi:hypothetical protein
VLPAQSAKVGRSPTGSLEICAVLNGWRIKLAEG